MYNFYHFFISNTILSKKIQGRGLYVYTNTAITTVIDHPPNAIFVVPPHSVSLPQNNITIGQNKPLQIRLILILTLMTTHSILKLLLKNKHTGTELSDTHTTMDQVQIEFNPRQIQKIPSTQTTSLKIPSSGKGYLCFKLMKELLAPPNVKDQEY